VIVFTQDCRDVLVPRRPGGSLQRGCCADLDRLSARLDLRSAERRISPLADYGDIEGITLHGYVVRARECPTACVGMTKRESHAHEVEDRDRADDNLLPALRGLALDVVAPIVAVFVSAQTRPPGR
jgi:hypothetical protein